MNNDYRYYQGRRTSDDSSPGMATAALVLGICSLVLFFTGLSFITGALGILLALLSRGSLPMRPAAQSGLILSVIGLVIEISLFGFIFYLFCSGAIDPYLDQIQQMYENFYAGGLP